MTRACVSRAPWQQAPASAGLPAHRVADTSDASFSVTFTGTQATLDSVARRDGGYARITLRDVSVRQVLDATVDMYSQSPASSVKFVTPLLARGSYTLSARVAGDGWYWVNKKGERSGSRGHAISFERLAVRK